MIERIYIFLVIIIKSEVWTTETMSKQITEIFLQNSTTTFVVGNDGTEIGNNPICYKQFEVMTFGAVNFSCSQNVFGAWVSINKSSTDVFTECLVIQEVRIYGSKSK